MLKNVGSNWVLNIYIVVVSLIQGPYMVDMLGRDGDGVWRIVLGATALLGLLVMGVPMASVRFFSEHLAVEDKKSLNQAISSCIGLYLFLGMVALVVGAIFYIPFDMGLERAIDKGHVNAIWRSDARFAYALVVLHIAFGFVAQLPYGIMVAHHDFVRRNTVMISGLTAKLFLIFLLLWLKSSISMLAIASLGVLLAEFLVAWRIVVVKYPGTQISLRNFDRAMVKKIFSFSIFVLFLQLGIKLSFYLDGLVINWYMPAEYVSYYDRSGMFLVYLIEFLIAIGAVVMPMAARLRVQNRTDELGAVFLKWSKVAMCLTAMSCMFLAILGPEFVSAWLQDYRYRAPAEAVLPILMGASLVFLPIRGVALPLLMGLGKPGLPTVAFLVSGVVNLALKIILVPRLGLQGAAIGTAVPSVIFGVVVGIYVCRTIGVGAGAYFRYVYPKVLVGSLPVLALLFWIKYARGIEGRFEILAAGMMTAGLFGVMTVFYIYRNDEHVDLLGILKRKITQ